MKNTDLIKNSIITLLFSTLFIPFFVSNSLFFPFITGKGFFFRFVISVAVILYVWLIIQNRSYLPRLSVITVTILSFLGIMLVANINGENPYKSFLSNFERMEGYITLVYLAAYFILLTTVFNTQKIWRLFFNFSLGVSVLVGFRALFDLSTMDRIMGTLGNSSYLAVYALIHIFFAGYFLIKIFEREKNYNNFLYQIIYYFSTIILNVFVLYFTGTRGAVLGLGLGIITMSFIIAIFERHKIYLRNLAIGIIIFSLTLIILFGSLRGTELAKNNPLIERYSSLVTLDFKQVFQSQGYSRTLLWPMAWSGVVERPILGWGQENFNYVFAKYYNPNMYGQEQWFDRAHNVFLDWLIAGGFLGLMSYLALSIVFIVFLLRINMSTLNQAEKAVFVGLIVAYSIHNLFVFDHLVSYIFFFALLAFVNYLSDEKEKEHNIPMFKNPIAIYSIRTISVIAGVVLLNFAILKPIKANVTIIDALRSQAGYTSNEPELGGNPQLLRQMLASFEKGLSYNTFANTEIREQLITSTSNVLRNDKEVFSQGLQLALTEIDKQIKETPNDPRPYFLMAVFLSGSGLYDEALRYVEKAEELSPNKQSFKFIKGEIFINQGKRSEAVKVFEDAYELAKQNEQAKTFYAVSLVYSGDSEKFDSLVKEDSSLVLDSRVISALILTKQVNKALSLVDTHIKKQSTVVPRDYFLLAALYLESGNRNQALSVLNNLKKNNKDASFVAEIDGYISTINSGVKSLFGR